MDLLIRKKSEYGIEENVINLLTCKNVRRGRRDKEGGGIIC